MDKVETKELPVLKHIDRLISLLTINHKSELAAFLKCSDKTLTNHIAYCKGKSYGRRLNEKYFDAVIDFANERTFNLIELVGLTKRELDMPPTEVPSEVMNGLKWSI